MCCSVKGSKKLRILICYMQDAAELTSIQINEIWNLWYDCLRVMLHLKSREQQLQSLVQGAVQQAFLSPGMAANGVLLNAGWCLPRPHCHHPTI
jgi:hypothetical protein